MLDEASHGRRRLFRDSCNRGEVEHGLSCLGYAACALPEEEEVVDEVRVLRHPQPLRTMHNWLVIHGILAAAHLCFGMIKDKSD